MLQKATCLADHGAKLKPYSFEMGSDPIVTRRFKSTEQLIAAQLARSLRQRFHGIDRGNALL